MKIAEAAKLLASAPIGTDVFARTPVYGILTLAGHARRLSVAIGQDGLWRTAHLKTYPSPLCRFLASCFLDETRTRFPELSVAPEHPPVQSLAVVRPPHTWTLNDERALRALVDLDDAYDGWSAPTGLRRFVAPLDPYLVQGISMDCMLHRTSEDPIV